MNETNDSEAIATQEPVAESTRSLIPARLSGAPRLPDSEREAKNARRNALIQKKYRGIGLAPAEEAELARLQPEVSDEIMARHIRPRVFASDSRRMELLRRHVLGDAPPLSPAEERELEQLQAALLARNPKADIQSSFADPEMDAWLAATEARLAAEDRQHCEAGNEA